MQTFRALTDLLDGTLKLAWGAVFSSVESSGQVMIHEVFMKSRARMRYCGSSRFFSVARGPLVKMSVVSGTCGLRRRYSMFVMSRDTRTVHTPV